MGCDDKACKVCRTFDVLTDSDGVIDPIDGLDALGVVAAQLLAAVPPEVLHEWVGKLAILRDKIMREEQGDIATGVPTSHAIN